MGLILVGGDADGEKRCPLDGGRRNETEKLEETWTKGVECLIVVEDDPS